MLQQRLFYPHRRTTFWQHEHYEQLLLKKCYYSLAYYMVESCIDIQINTCHYLLTAQTQHTIEQSTVI